MPQPVSYNPGTPVSGSIQENSISYVVDGQNRNYRGGYGGLSWMSEAPAANNVIFIGNTTDIGRGPSGKPLFYPSYNTTQANIVYAVNKLPGSPGNFTTTASAYEWAVDNNFFINNSDNPIPRADADGLAFYVDANQPTSYPQTNTKWYDLSGNGRTSTLTNGPSWKQGGWIEFDGADDRSTTSFGFLSNSESHEAWIYSKGSVSTYNMFMGIILPYYGFYTGNTFIVQDYIGGAQVGYFTGTLSLNRWYHFLSTRSYNGTNTTLTTYINGTLSNQATYSGAPNIAGGTWAIGNWDAPSAGASYPFYGNISGAKIYTKALTLAEVKQNYFQSNIVTDGLVFMADASNLVSYPKSGTVAYNLTGSLTGSLINGVGFSSEKGGIWEFDGVDDRIDFQSPFGDIDWGTTAFTVMGWMKIGGSDDNDWCLLSSATNSNLIFGTLPYPAANRIYVYGIRNSLGSYPANQVFNFYADSFWPNSQWRDTWLHVTMTYNGNGLSLGNFAIYTNGVSRTLGTGGSASYPNTTQIRLGRSSYGTGPNEFPNLLLYNRALSATEVQQNYEATKDKFLGQNIVTNGLVLNLDAANKDSYPGTGTTWTDLSGYGDNGTLINGPTFLPSVNGGVISFDGVDDYVTASNVYDFGASNAITAEIWAKSDNATWNDYGYLISRRNQFIIHPQLSSTEVYFYIFAGGYQSVSLIPSSITVFNQYVLTYNNGDLRAYLNGSLGANASVGSPLSSYSGDTYIGKDDFLARYLDGSVGSVKLYNRALSATEVLQNYNAQKTRFGL